MSMSDRERRYVARRYKYKYERSAARRTLRRLRKAQRMAGYAAFAGLAVLLDAVLPFTPLNPDASARQAAELWGVGAGGAAIVTVSVVVAVVVRQRAGRAVEKLEQANRGHARAWLRLYELRASLKEVV
ncbi:MULTISPECIES: hypothetical protein [Paraburkholderia]|uniref:hypothetical protein n=1 Tax=Paraburkholderia TaxID=1822464 RepID=UPI001F2265F4|nr:hypothetical protein [Paraburkholderia tropica]